MVFSTQDYWVLGICPSSGIPKGSIYLYLESIDISIGRDIDPVDKAIFRTIDISISRTIEILLHRKDRYVGILNDGRYIDLVDLSVITSIFRHIDPIYIDPFEHADISILSIYRSFEISIGRCIDKTIYRSFDLSTY